VQFYPLRFYTVDDILVLTKNPVSEDTIRSDDDFQAIAMMHRGVILDMSGMEFVSSEAIGIIVTLHKKTTPLKKKMKWVINNDAVRELFSITALPSVFSGPEDLDFIFDTVEEAVNSEW